MTNLLTSPKLTALKEDLQRLKAGAAQSRATVWQLTERLNPQSHDVTVRRVETYNERADKGAEAGVLITGADSEKAEAARKAEALKRTLEGKPLADSTGVKEQKEKANREWVAYEDAIEFRTREIQVERNALAIEYTKKIKPQADQRMVKLGKAALDFHAAWLDANELRQHLIDEEVGLRGIFQTMPDWLSNARNPHSEFGEWVRALKGAGFISAVPAELKGN